MARRPATQKEILEAIAARLREKIALYNDQNCFLSDQPAPVHFPGGREACTVSPGAGTFDQVNFDGAGIATLTENASVTVSILINNKRDRPAQASRRLMDDSDGILVRKQQILGALLGEDWEPIGADGAYVLRSQLAPESATAPGDVRVGEAQLVVLSIIFAIPFDWIVIDPGGEDCAFAEPTC